MSGPGKQLRFDGEVFTVARLKVSATGLDKVPYAFEGDERPPERGAIMIASCGYWVSPVPFEKHNDDGIGIETPELLYNLTPVPGFHPFTVEKLIRRQERMTMYGMDEAKGA